MDLTNGLCFVAAAGIVGAAEFGLSRARRWANGLAIKPHLTNAPETSAKRHGRATTGDETSNDRNR